MSLSTTSGNTVTVNYATAPGSAGPADFSATSGTLTFIPGDTAENITVPIFGDVLDENNETFTVTLSNPISATITDGSGIGTILDDDTATLSIADTTVLESNPAAVFTVTLSTPSASTVTVDYSTVDGSATAGSDYLATAGQLTFAPGATLLTFTVTITNDTLVESNETFTATLSNPANAGIAKAVGLGTILNDDSAGGTLTLPATADTWIDYYNQDTNYAADTELQIDPQGSGRNRALLRFDLSSIPAGSTIISATLVLTVNAAQTGHTVNIYRVITDWTETDVTWNQATTGTAWTAGGDYDSGTIWGSYSPDVTGSRVISLTTLVQNWVDATYSNFGILLNGTGASGVSTIWSHDAPGNNGATLLVEYSQLGGLSLGVEPEKPQRIFLPVILKSAQPEP